jgi:hypothetical protein
MAQDIFRINHAKATNNLTINSFLIGSVFFIFSIIWTLDPHKFSKVLMVQLVFSIPLLFVSSLAYAKIAYWKETKLWDSFAWFTNTVANIFLLNVVGLMVAEVYRDMSMMYFFALIGLLLVYSLINIVYRPDLFKQKIFKFLFFAVGVVIGGIFPLL